nr:MAG TPA: hypothetical protein [Caudoviricetes sp.]
MIVTNIKILLLFHYIVKRLYLSSRRSDSLNYTYNVWK